MKAGEKGAKNNEGQSHHDKGEEKVNT